ncbi:MAG: tetratricopeptide repeat protein [Desulfobacterales bacterium]
MTPEPNRLSREPRETRNFLLSKARSDAVPRTAGPSEADQTADSLRRAFPHLLSGKSLLVRAMSRLEEVSEFAAAVVQIDAGRPADHLAAGDNEPAVQTTLARALETVCRPTSGLWGLLDAITFGCFLPGGTSCATIAPLEAIEKTVADAAGATVTIGLAFFPSLDFPKEAILENARKALEHAKFFGPGSRVAFDAISLNISGDSLYDQGEYQKAIDEYQTALRLDPANANLHNSLGVCYGVTGEFAQAMDRFKEAIALDTGEALAHYNAGLVHLLLDERDKARAHLLEVDNRPHNLFEVRLQLGKIYLEDGQPDLARIYLENAAAMWPQSSTVHCLLGECYAALDLTADAMAAYKKSLRLNANDPAALSGLGCLYHALGQNTDIAMLYCRHSTAIAPQNGLFHHRLGCLYLKQDQLAEAQDEFRTAEALGCDCAAQLADVKNRLLDIAS